MGSEEEEEEGVVGGWSCDVLDVGEGADGGVDVERRASGGTASRARSRLSMDSTRSTAKRWMANWRADSMSRLVRSWRLRNSATERRYLSCFAMC